MKSEISILKLVAMTYGGEAMGRDESGRIVFVPYAIAGEEVVVEIVEEKKNFARARLVEVVKASPARVEPRCAHFGPPPQPSPVGDRGGSIIVEDYIPGIEVALEGILTGGK